MNFSSIAHTSVMNLSGLSVLATDLASLGAMVDKVGVCKRQRSHEGRVRKAKHVRGLLELDKRVFSGFQIRGEEVVYLVDGYTRLEAFKGQLLSEVPGQEAVLVVHEVADWDEAGKLYDQINSQVSAKKGRDYFNGALRDCGIDVEADIHSHLVKLGAMPTAVSVAASGVTAVYSATRKVHQGVMWLDSLMLGKTDLVSGACAAAVAVGMGEPAAVKPLAKLFFQRLSMASFTPVGKGDSAIEALRTFIASRRAGKTLSGAANVGEIANKTLNAYMSFLGLELGVTHPAIRTLGDYYAFRGVTL